ncbi:ATP-binding cassette domain-containing protein [Ruminococcus sp. HUN007]|uniref:ATP-binding cassette domain-containing protein n=1 Tax=Ruminococcus sp. HUN007 TaxID=1514668 RepID=UPI0005D27DE6|nr:ATP-binding cassette domain-containing protein [Ruminococcus sp. HUN007]
MDYFIETNELTKNYRGKTAVDKVSLHVKKGEIYGLIGKNGAGKTTCMKMLAGLVRPDGGDIIKHPGKGSILKTGCLIENPGLYYDMTAAGNLKCKCLLEGCWSKEYADSLLRFADIADTGKKKASQFSLGMKQRLGIAMALAGDPEFLILDEPINGLDPQGILQMRNLFTKLRDEKKVTIMISSHILSELDKVADTVGIINNGKLIREVDEELLRLGACLEITTPDAEKAAEALRKSFSNEIKTAGDRTIQVFGAETEDEVIAINKCVAESAGLIGSKRTGSDLESVYIDIMDENGVKTDDGIN